MMPWYIITGKEDREQREQIEEAIRKISRELNNLGLELEPKKTNLVKFEETEEEITEIEVQGSKYQEKEVKFLKLIFDKRLAFDTQIELTRDKMMKTNNLLKYMNGIKVWKSTLQRCFTSHFTSHWWEPRLTMDVTYFSQGKKQRE